MAKVSRKIRTLFDARVREKGLTLARARTLLRIARGEAANQKELAEELEIETATLVRLIDGLEVQGLIARREVEGDRRAKHVVLTRAGEALAEVVDRMVTEIGHDVLRGMDERELTAALTSVRKMAGNLEAISLEPAE
jgi:MarR family transcriptional regulator for hemolysin